MIFSFNPDTYKLDYHGSSNTGYYAIALLSNGGCTTGTVSRQKAALSHGVIMWICWTVISLAQIWTNRYLVHYWKWRQTLHSVLGAMSGLLTLIAAIVILNWMDWKF